MQLHLASNPSISGVVQEVYDFVMTSGAETGAITFQCRAGKHRSVAAVELIAHVLETMDITVHKRHLSLENHPRRVCRFRGCQCSELVGSTPEHARAQSIVMDEWLALQL